MDRFRAAIQSLILFLNFPTLEQEAGNDDLRTALETKRKRLQGDALVAAAVMGPVMPYLSATIAAGIGAANILGKLCRRYEVETLSSLAKHLGFNRSTLENWLHKDEVPKQALQKALDDGKITVEEIVECEDYLLISKKGFRQLVKETWTDKNGLPLSDKDVDALILRAKATRES